MDSTATISLIQKPLDQNHPYRALIGRIQRLLASDWAIHIKHICIEANRAADCIAHIGHSLPLGLHFFCVLPLALHAIRLDDACGVAIPRMVM